MADVITKTRTNYFGCTNPAELEGLVKSLKTDGGPAMFVQEDGKCMFYCEGEIQGCLTPLAAEKLKSDPDWADDNPDEAYSHELFLEKLQGLVAKDDACVMKSIGYEGMRDIWSDAYIITRSVIHRVDFGSKIKSAVGDILKTESGGRPSIEMHLVPPKKDICSCHMCGAKNFGRHAANIYDVKFGSQVIRLCPECARDLHAAIQKNLGI